jgi:stearoyl-CoA desaturase (delta-9 desaturase)
MNRGVAHLWGYWLKLDYRNLSFLIVAHGLAVVALFYLASGQARWQTCVFALLWLCCCSISITGGYHRLLAHRAYRAAWPVRLFYLLFGAASLQNSALPWCADHRAHHAHTDGVSDPYSIARGFLWAHIGWVIFRVDGTPEPAIVRDLASDRLLRLQHRHYLLLAVLMGAVIPAAVGWLWDDATGAVLLGGFLRVVLQWHATFAVNSIAHMIGRQPYTTAVSARDSVFTALVTLGEGYHNFHHRFPSDYRNGFRWYQFDPTKWFVWTLCKLRLASGLKRASLETIESARMSVVSAANCRQ